MERAREARTAVLGLGEHERLRASSADRKPFDGVGELDGRLTCAALALLALRRQCATWSRSTVSEAISLPISPAPCSSSLACEISRLVVSGPSVNRRSSPFSDSWMSDQRRSSFVSPRVAVLAGPDSAACVEVLDLASFARHDQRVVELNTSGDRRAGSGPAAARAPAAAPRGSVPRPRTPGGSEADPGGRPSDRCLSV